MDLKVLEVQKWLNLTYGNHPDFPAVTEDGLTGNSTIKALIRGLQIEAGVKVDGVLGSGSLAAIGTIRHRWTPVCRRIVIKCISHRAVYIARAIIPKDSTGFMVVV